MENIQYLTTKQIAESDCYPFTIGQMRFFLTNRHKNGLGHAVRKISKRLYIKKDLFDQWIESQSERRDQLK